MAEYLDTLATFAADLHLDALPEAVLATARRHVLDTLGVIRGGDAGEVRRIADRRPAGPCWTPVGRKRPSDAAFVNGVAGTWLDYDLGHRWSGGHPAIHVLPAVLAIAEETGQGGEAVLTAFIAGCEIAARIGLAIGKLAPGLHPHGSWPVLGAVAAAGRLRGFDASAIRRAMELAATLTLVTSWRTAFGGATIRDVYAGYGAELAVQVPDLVLAGFEGEPDGVGVVFGGIAAPKIIRRRATVELGSRWEFSESYIKPYAFARFGHAAVDLLREMNLDPDTVESIDIATYALGGAMRDQNPANELAAKFSAPWAVAAYLVHRDCGPSAFRGETLDDPAIRALARRVTIREDAGWEGLNPAWRGATLTVTLKDGTVRRAETSQTRGDPERPLTDDEIFDKFDSFVEGEIHGDILVVDRFDDIRDLTRRLPGG